MGAVKDSTTGVEFPPRQQFWVGGPLTCLGAGARTKKVGFLTVKVYAVAMYVDSAAASKGHPGPGASALDVLQSGQFCQALQMHLVRDVTGKQFTDALDEALRPAMRGNEAVLAEFCSFFDGKQLHKGTEVTLLRRADGALDACLRGPSHTGPYSSMQPGKTIQSGCMGQALWQFYLSPDSPAPEARDTWLAAVPALVATAPAPAGPA